MIHRFRIYQQSKKRFRRYSDQQHSGLRRRGSGRHCRFCLCGAQLFTAESRPTSTAAPSRHGSAGSVGIIHSRGVKGQPQLPATIQTQTFGHGPSFLKLVQARRFKQGLGESYSTPGAMPRVEPSLQLTGAERFQLAILLALLRPQTAPLRLPAGS